MEVGKNIAIPERNQSITYASFERPASSSANKQILYVGGDAYSAPAVYINLGSSWALYYICRDYLGSITHLVNSSGNVTQENSYDA